MWFLVLIAAVAIVWLILEHEKNVAIAKRAQQEDAIRDVYAQQGLAIRHNDIAAIIDTKHLSNTHWKVLDSAIRYTLTLERSGRSTEGISEYATAKLRRLATEHGGVATDEDIGLVLKETITGDDFIRRSVERARQEGTSQEFAEFAKEVQALRETHGGELLASSGSFQIGRPE